MQLRFVKVETPAQIAETAALADVIWNECYSDLLSQGQIDYMVDKFQSAPAITAQIKGEGFEYYLAMEGDEAAGYVGIQPDKEKGRLYLSKIYLLQGCRGKGYAGQLFDFMTARAKALECPTLWLTVNRGNERAIAAYKKQGYTIVRTQDADIGGGYIMEDYVFEKTV